MTISFRELWLPWSAQITYKGPPFLVIISMQSKDSARCEISSIHTDFLYTLGNSPFLTVLNTLAMCQCDHQV